MDSQAFQTHIATMHALKGDASLVDHLNNLVEPLTAHQFLIRLNEASAFWNHDENKKASNGALRRWIEQGAFLFNHEKMQPQELLDFHLFSFVMFPKSEKKRCTLV